MQEEETARAGRAREAEQKQFVSALTHELRTPLNAVVGFRRRPAPDLQSEDAPPHRSAGMPRHLRACKCSPVCALLCIRTLRPSTQPPAIPLCSTLVLESPALAEGDREHLSAALTSASAMLGVVNQLLDFYKLQVGLRFDGGTCVSAVANRFWRLGVRRSGKGGQACLS